MPRDSPLPIHHTYRASTETIQSGRLRQLSLDQDALLTYAVKVTGFRCCLMGFLLTLSLPVSMVVMGAVYFHSCPAKPVIPMYLIGEGSAILIYMLVRCTNRGQNHTYIAMLFLIVAGLFIAGSVWVFQIYRPNFHEIIKDKYCDENLYLYAFWVTISEYILLAVVILYLCIICQLSIDVH